MIVAALILLALPSSDAVICVKQVGCMAQKIEIHEPDWNAPLVDVECPDKCAAWSCVVGNAAYFGSGCESDNKFCKDVKDARLQTCDTTACNFYKLTGVRYFTIFVSHFHFSVYRAIKAYKRRLCLSWYMQPKQRWIQSRCHGNRWNASSWMVDRSINEKKSVISFELCV